MAPNQSDLIARYSEPEYIQAQALLQISLAINSHLKLKDILDQVVHYTIVLVGCKHASILLWNSRRSEFETGASSDFGAAVTRRVRSQGGASRWILDNGQRLIVPDIRQDPFSANPMLLETNIRAYAGIPIQNAGETIGVLYALSQQYHNFDHGELESMQALATMAAIAIHNAQLLQSLQELNKFKDMLVQLAAHDLRTPLSYIIGYLDLLAKELDPLSPEQTEWVNIIWRSLAQMDNLISGILNYKRLTTEGELKPQPCDLNAIALKVVIDHEIAARQKSHRLTLNTASYPLLVQGDEVLLQEVAGNLLSNAIKYTPPHGEITIETHRRHKKLVLSVSDTGPGIQPEEQDQLFQPFVRLQTAEGAQGSGLGLSLVKRIVERHNGTVSVESTPGKGTTFSIYFPTAVPKKAADS